MPSAASSSSSEFKELVRSRTDLVALIGETRRLTSLRGGTEFATLCPFHDDHNPSMRIYPDRQSYRCWVCNEGGDCFSYVMKSDNVGFREALEILARRAHLELPRELGGREAGGESKNRLFEVLQWAEQQFHRHLLTSESEEASRAREYLRSRNISQESIAKFHIGYHPNDWEWLLRKGGTTFPPELLHAARLVRERREGHGYRDDFVDRVLFPIRDERGRTVAFGGRILPGQAAENAPKYLNSPESILFSKSRLLYGLDVARESIRKSETVIIVEGYTDCTMLHQYGIGNAVGTLGTALTESHVSALRRFARRVILVYDGDAAGQRAAERSLPKFLAQDVDLRILTLPGDLDPADFLVTRGGEAFSKLLDSTVEAWEHKLRLSVDRYGVESVDSRGRILEEMLELVSLAPGLAGTGREAIILGRLSQRLGIGEAVVRKKLEEARGRLTGHSLKVTLPEVGNPEGIRARHLKLEELDRAEKREYELLEILFVAPEWAEAVRLEIGADEYQHDILRDLLHVCFDLSEQGILPGYEQVTLAIDDPGLKSAAALVIETARLRGIEEKLKEERVPPVSGRGDETPGDTLPPFLREALERVKWRRQERSHERNRGQMALAATEDAARLNDEAKSYLRRSTEFHARRAAQKPGA